MKKLARIHFLSLADRLQPLRDYIRQLLSAENIDQKKIAQIVLAVNEACMNCIQHAFRGQGTGEIIIEFWLENKQLLIRILDDAPQVTLQNIRSRPLQEVRPGGLGVHLIHQLMDSVEYAHRQDQPGNSLEIRTALNNGSENTQDVL